METLEQILKMWENDAIIDQTEPSKELIKIPVYHSKYLGILTKHKIAAKKAHFDYLRMKKIKTEYFTGKLSQEELSERGWEPFQYVLKSDIATYIDSDNDLITLMQKKIYQKTKKPIMNGKK